MNNQMSDRLTVNDEGVQRMIDNDSAMYYSNQMIIAQNMTHRPVNTIKANSAKNGALNRKYVMERGRKLRRNLDGISITLGREPVLAYVKAIAVMYNKQKALGLNFHWFARGPLVRTFLGTLEKENFKSKSIFKPRFYV
ncbi:uncharacterized protein RHIMIDRAFT_234615 [Rhizopus microsporus ATCC 52813]|uniref:Uncharacterized protein n=1 Tax=Rhizopus microsporus ATCC 52813 TaxID=1340429 RepID=A0A2G4T3K3_RHIZD|nr:uncharacterized protein RHIMIDRAFT_234615 [Rhizopus microsporus ATCC 52813]PHZ15256.1 hypothetical protein RHIMIDRAFT_234615 [Rhizopus microsporus ATCC 52813]